jgi:hypothetical protein
MDDDGRIQYPTVEEILSIHERIIEEDADSEPGIENEQKVEFALDYGSARRKPRASGRG